MGNRWIAIKEEAAYGTNPGTWTIIGGVKQIPVADYTPTPNNNMMGLKESVDLMEAGGILGGFVGENRISMYARPDNLENMLKWVMGGVSSAAHDGVQQHTYSVVDGVKSFSMEYRHGYGALLPIFTLGNVVKSIEFNAAQNRPCMAEITTQYKTEDIATAGLALDATVLPALRPYTLYDATVTSFGESLKCENVRVRLERAIPDDVHTSGSRFLPDISEEGFTISGELDARFTTFTQRSKFYGGVSGAETAPHNDFLTGVMTLYYLGQASGVVHPNYDMTISLPAVALQTLESGTTGRERLRQRIGFQAYSHTSAGATAAPSIVLSNDVAGPV